MSEVEEIIHLPSLAEQLDELSTRLMLSGGNSLRRSDFEQLSRSAADLGCVQFAQCAADFAAVLAPTSLESSVTAQNTQVLISALSELRTMLAELDRRVPEPRSQGPLTSKSLGDTGALAADEDLVREFITESSEHLGTIESELLVLETDNSATESLNTIFRGFHTIKGLAGFLEFGGIQSVTHEIETLLDLARTSQLAIDGPIVDLLLETTDILRQELDAIERKLAGHNPLPSRVNPGLLNRIRQASHQEISQKDAYSGMSLPPLDTATSSSPLSRSSTLELRRQSTAASSSLRIDTAKLDQLMDMVGEMVIAQTLIQHSDALRSVTDAPLQRNLTQLTRITADVQRITTGMRMVPIGLQFNKTARMVRDLSRRAGKTIIFEVSGEDTELDKTIAEQLADPLLHMVRNSIDHGIEPAEERAALGKEPAAHIRVSAQHQAGQILITVSDDGRGLDREKILAKGVHKGLVVPGAQLTDNEIFCLIFEAGFSTAATVTDISGRGVGMDVVRRHVQKLRGRIDIQSAAGHGTTFSIKLPLTLAIIEGLVVEVGQHRYIVPIFCVREMFRPTDAMLSTVQRTAEMALVRGSLLPIIRLHRRFGIAPRTTDLTAGTLIVTESEGRSFCLFVDDLIGKQEVVIKSLGRRFKDVAGLAGCAILGDGRVGLILDIDGIYKGRTT